MSRLATLLNWPGALLTRAAMTTLALLPRRLGHAAGRGAGIVFYLVSPRHRRAAHANVRRAFGDRLDAAAQRRLVRDSFQHVGWMVADAVYFPRYAGAPLESVAVYEGEEHLRAAAREGKGVLIFSGHYGHWELIALLQSRLGVPMSMIVRPLDNRRLDLDLARLRGLTGNTLIEKRNAARGVLRALREGRAVAILIDQNVRGEGGIFVDFFGAPASTTPALAIYAFKTGAPIVPVFSRPLPDGRLLISYRPAIHAVRSGDLQDDILRLTRDCTAILEEEIRAHPRYWMWMHNRWRTRPPLAGGAGPRPGVAAAMTG